jgi:hypothetical protein
METEFKYKLDFYYQQTVIYLVTFVLYATVKGSISETKFSLVFSDPILIIMMFFIVMALTMLVLNRIRGRKLIVSDTGFVFQHRFGSHAISLRSIEWLKITRERRVQTSGIFQVVVFKLRGRHRLYRIRVGRYEREKELIAAIEKIAVHVPKGEHRRFSMWRKVR